MVGPRGDNTVRPAFYSLCLLLSDGLVLEGRRDDGGRGAASCWSIWGGERRIRTDSRSCFDAVSKRGLLNWKKSVGAAKCSCLIVEKGSTSATLEIEKFQTCTI